METLYSSTGFGDQQNSIMGGWFGDRQNSTGSRFSGLTKYIVAVGFGLLVSAGTGASADDLARLQQARKSETTLTDRVRPYNVEIQPARTTAEDMQQIRKVFSPAMSDLAKSINVSRQTTYNWLNGEQPTPEHSEQLRELALVADIFARAGISVNSTVLKRKVIKGKNLFDILREGGSARDAGQLLLEIVKIEAEQRERMAARFAGRKVSQRSADSYFIAPNDEV
jgi:DNA-binding XRE family transcriptional regulator